MKPSIAYMNVLYPWYQWSLSGKIGGGREEIRVLYLAL
jgi:hypothetical protein